MDFWEEVDSARICACWYEIFEVITCDQLPAVETAWGVDDMMCVFHYRAMLKFHVDVAELSTSFGDIFVNMPDDNGPAFASWLNDRAIPFSKSFNDLALHLCEVMAMCMRGYAP